MIEDKPGKWRWYHHVIVVVAVFAFALLWGYLRPSDRVANIVLAGCAAVLVVSLVAIQWQKRRHLTK